MHIEWNKFNFYGNLVIRFSFVPSYYYTFETQNVGWLLIPNLPPSTDIHVIITGNRLWSSNKTTPFEASRVVRTKALG